MQRSISDFIINFVVTFVLSFCVLLSIIVVSNNVLAKAIDGDFSDNLIEIDASFTGEDILLFGIKRLYGDLVIVVRGPQESYNIYKKEKVGPVWINRKHARFSEVYSFYNVYSTKPLKEIGADTLLKNLNIGNGAEDIRTTGKIIAAKNPGEVWELRNAIFGYKLGNQLYKQDFKDSISFRGSSLFKAIINFPEKISNGLYTAEVYLISNGMLSGVQVIPIEVKKVGFEAFMHDFAHDHALIYGIVAVLIAIFAGWFASMIFWKT